MRKKTSILFVAQNPGSFNAIFPIYSSFKKQSGYALEYIFSDDNKTIVKDKSIKLVSNSDYSQRRIKQIIASFIPKVIVTGTSEGKSLEKKAIRSSMTFGIKTVSIVDFWGNYKMRFSDPGTKNLRYLPDYILVVDEYSKEQMIAVGFDSKIIYVTGNPFFDSFGKAKSRKYESEIVSFFCQPFSELSRDEGNGKLPFNEVSVFKDLVKVFEEMDITNKILIKLHPRTKNFTKFDRIIDKSHLEIKVVGNSDVKGIISRSLLVTGMSSVTLFQASLMGKKVLSYQPGCENNDPFISNKLGLTVGAYSKKSLKPIISRLLSLKISKNKKVINRYTRNESTDKVVNFIKGLI